MPSLKEWREIATLKTWDHADMMRNAIIRDTPSIDVRLRHESGIYVVEISGPELR